MTKEQLEEYKRAFMDCLIYGIGVLKIEESLTMEENLDIKCISVTEMTKDEI